MTALVFQRAPNDCAICCLAMLTAASYETVLAEVGPVYDPERGLSDTRLALHWLGMSDTWEDGEPAGNFLLLHRPFEISPEYFRRLAWRRRALFSVPSLNNPGGWHMVYWDGRRVWDPAAAKPRAYVRFDELIPSEIVLFDEGKEAPHA